MKLSFYKFILILLFTFFLFFTKAFAVDIKFYQWFDKFSTINNWINFICNSQCVIWIDELKYYKKLEIKWNLYWTWKVELAFLINNKLVPADIRLLKNNNIIFYFTDFKFYNQIPKNAIITLIFLWKIKGNDVKIELSNKLWFFKMVKDFFRIEWITPYIINLKYWGKLFNIPEIKFLTYFWLIFIWLILLLSIKNKFKYTLYVLLILTSIVFFKNLYEYIIVTKQNIENFQNHKTVFYLNDYYNFIKDIRNLIDFNDCTYNVLSYQNWPFATWSKNIYLKPCKYVSINPEYVIIYKDKIPMKYRACNILYNKNYNLLLKCK